MGWQTLGGLQSPASSGPLIGIDTSERLHFFVVGADSQLYHIQQKQAGGGQSAWECRGGPCTGAVVVGRNKSGRLEAFAIRGKGINATLWHTWQKSPDGSEWSEWDPLSGAFADYDTLCVLPDHHERLELFRTVADNDVQHRWQTVADGDWHPQWLSLGFRGKLVGIGVGRNNHPGVATKRLEVFALAKDGVVYHVWQKDDQLNWSAVEAMPTGPLFVDGPTVASNSDGTLVVFALDKNGVLHHTFQQRDTNRPPWSNWFALPGARLSEAPVAALNANGKLEVFGRQQGTGNVIHAWQTASGWSAWGSMGEPSDSVPAAARNKVNPPGSADPGGRLEVVISRAGQIKNSWQDKAGQGPWRP